MVFTFSKNNFSRTQSTWIHYGISLWPGDAPVILPCFCHRQGANFSIRSHLPMESKPRRKIIWRFRVVGITRPAAKQIFATWKTRWWISFQFSQAVSLKGTEVAFFKSGIMPSGVSGLIAVVSILKNPTKRRQKKTTKTNTVNWNIHGKTLLKGNLHLNSSVTLLSLFHLSVKLQEWSTSNFGSHA